MQTRVRTEKRLNLLAKKVLKRLKKRGASVDIIPLDGRELGRLKARFGLKKKGKKPDVLAFPEPPNFPQPGRLKKSLGEIYLNRELPAARLEFLLIHGILHLLGYAHEGKNDILKMEKLEKKLMDHFSKKRTHVIKMHRGA